MPAASASPTAFTTHRTTAALSASASLTIPQPSPPIPSPPGGNAKGRVVGAAFPNCWSWRTPVAAIAALPGPGRPKSRLSCAMPSASPLPSLTIPPAPPNGIPSSIACSPRFPKTGCRAAGQLRQNAQLHSHYQYPNRLGCDCLSGPERISDRSQTRPASDLRAPPKAQQHTVEMELHHCTESVGLLLRRPLVERGKGQLPRGQSERKRRVGP